MSSKQLTTINVRPSTRDELWQYKRGPGDTYDDALQRVLSRVSNEQ